MRIAKTLSLHRSIRFCLIVICLSASALMAAPRCPLKPAPQALFPAEKNELLFATQNLWRLVDDHTDASADRAVSPQYFKQRLHAVAEYIGATLRWPHFLAVQEVENAKMMHALADEIKRIGGPEYQFVLKDSLDPSGIDVAVLYRAPVKIGKIESPFHEMRFKRSPLYSRPPLVVTLTQPIAMTAAVVHLRSGINLEDERKGKNVQAKRRQQANVLRDWMMKKERSGESVMVLGDFNSSYGDPVYAESITILDKTPFESVWYLIPEADRFSYIYQCNPQAIDNILIGKKLSAKINRAAFSRGNAGYQYYLYKRKAPYFISDHDALGVYLKY